MEISPEQRAKFSKIGKSNVRTAKSHERKIAKLLTDWTGRPFRRRRVEGRGNDVKVVEGVADIISIEDEILFAIEAKKGKDFSIDGLMANPTGAKFTQWYHQVSFDAQLLTDKTKTPRYPMLFFKPNANCDWIAVPFLVFQQNILTPCESYQAEYITRRKHSEIWFPHIYFDTYSWIGPVEQNISRSKNKIMKALPLLPVILARWRDFEKFVNPNSIFIQN